MGYRIVKDGNAFYEIDEDCIRELRKRTEAAGRRPLKGGQAAPEEKTPRRKKEGKYTDERN